MPSGILRGIALAGLIAGLLVACQSHHANQPTVVYLVRHAEKDLTDPSAKNPSLTEAGYQRARHLAEELKDEKIAAVYSTNFERSVNTIKPLADQKKLSVDFYEYHDTTGMVEVIRKKHTGQTVIICGHGDNLLPIIRRLGAKPPLDSLGAFEYDKLFRVEMDNDRATATVHSYH